MPGQQDYSSLVTKAEKAVQGISDPDLKRIAFQKVLDDMMGTRDVRTSTGSKTASSRAKAPPSSGKASLKAGPKAYVEELLGEGFFKKPKSIGEVRLELENRGHHIPSTSLSGPLQVLCQRKALRRQRITQGNKKATFAYSQW